MLTDSEVVGKYLLHSANHFLLVDLGNRLYVHFFNYICKNFFCLLIIQFNSINCYYCFKNICPYIGNTAYTSGSLFRVSNWLCSVWLVAQSKCISSVSCSLDSDSRASQTSTPLRWRSLTDWTPSLQCFSSCIKFDWRSGSFRAK